MAAQPPEPSWQPAGPDQTQARAWPPPPPPPPQQSQQAQQDGYGYPPPSAQDAYGYPPPQAYPGARPGQPRAKRASGERGFFGSLFDFSFASFVTPKIVKVLYILFTIWTAMVSLLILIISFRTGGAVAGIFVLVVIIPVYVLLTLGVYRIILEAFMVLFRIYEETKKISERGQSQV